MEGAIFGLFAKEDIKSETTGKVLIEADEIIELKSTDEEGKITFVADLPIGATYYVKELYAPDGFVTNDEVKEFTFEYTSVVQHVTMVDEEKPAEKTPEGGKPVSDSPKTGDNTNLWLWFMLLGIGATGTGALAFMRKKKH